MQPLASNKNVESNACPSRFLPPQKQETYRESLIQAFKTIAPSAGRDTNWLASMPVFR